MREGWVVKPLGELCEILDNKRKPITKRDRVAGQYPYYGATCIQDYVDDYLFDEPLVLVGEDGAKWEAGDNTAFAVEGKIWVNNHAHVLRPNRKRLLDGWLVQFFVYSDLREFVSGLTVPKLNQGSLRLIPIPVPPINEQHRIVAKLDEAFEAIASAKEKAEQNLLNARALFDSYLDDVFSYKSKDWPSSLLGDTYRIGSSKRVYERDWTSSGVPFYGGKEIVKLAKYGVTDSASFISEEKYAEYARRYEMPCTGDVLMTARGTIGVGYIVKPGDRFYYKDGNVISLRAKLPSNPKFLLYAFKSHEVREQLIKLVGATVTHLPIEKAQALKIAMPNLDTQNKAVAQLEMLEISAKELESIYQQKINALDELKQSLLDQAFSGEL